MARAPSLSDEQNEWVRGALRTLMDEHNHNAAAVGRRIGKDPTWVTRFLNGTEGNGATLDTATIIARETQQSVTDLLRLPPRRFTPWGEIPGFEEAQAKAREVVSTYSDSVWAGVAAMYMEPAPDRVDPSMLLDAARLVDGMSRAKKLTSGSDTEPPSRRGRGKGKPSSPPPSRRGQGKSSSRIRTH